MYGGPELGDNTRGALFLAQRSFVTNRASSRDNEAAFTPTLFLSFFIVKKKNFLTHTISRMPLHLILNLDQKKKRFPCCLSYTEKRVVLRQVFSADSLTASVHPCVQSHALTSVYGLIDPVVRVRVRWIVETLKHPACAVGWVARLCRSWFFPGESNPNFPGEKTPCDDTVVK